MAKFYSGLDLGQVQDHSTLVTVERSEQPDPDRNGYTQNHYAVRFIRRWELGTPYPKIVEELKELFGPGELHRTTLVVDSTGVGKPVVEMIEASGITADVRPYSITCGSKEGDGTVPKVDLVGVVQATLQSRRLKFAEALPLTPILKKELESFRVKVTSDRNETFSAWREKDHDDLVLALAMAVWFGEKMGGGAGCYTPYGGGTPFDGLPPGTFEPGGLPRDMW